jgi:hypothetical protein
MKQFVLFFLLSAYPLATDAAEFQQRIAFERDDFVWIANRDGSEAKKVAAGSFPSISPDRKRVAFTSTEKTGDTYLRRIVIADVTNGTTKNARMPSASM